MDNPAPKKSGKGRPASKAAASHEAILDAVQQILQKKSVRDLTMEEVARTAGVGKPTLYKWWPTKARLVLTMLTERMATKLGRPPKMTAEEALHFRVQLVVEAFNGPFGKVVAGVIAEGQSDPSVLREFFELWVAPRRDATLRELQLGVQNGELREDTKPELVNDAIFGALYFRFLLGSVPLTAEFAKDLVEQTMRGYRRSPEPKVQK